MNRTSRKLFALTRLRTLTKEIKFHTFSVIEKEQEKRILYYFMKHSKWQKKSHTLFILVGVLNLVSLFKVVWLKNAYSKTIF